MPKFFVNQKGIAPVILVIILSVVFAGVFGVVYQSKKEIKVRSDKTSEVTQLKDSPAAMSASTNTEAKTGQNFKLSSKPFEQKDSALPQFSFYPPDGWLKDKGTYTASFKDKISVGVAYLALPPSVNLAVVQKNLNSLEEALDLVKGEVKKSSIDITSARKTKLNDTEGYLLEGKIKYGELSRKVLEEEIDKEIKNAQKKVIVSKEQIKKDIDEIVRKSDVKVIGYLFYKDGYVITVSGRALEEYWSQRSSQLKSSLDTFKFE